MTPKVKNTESPLSLAAVPVALFAFNRNAVAAELSSATNDECLVHLEVAWTEDLPPVPDFVPVHSGHPALEEAARSLGIPYERDMEIPSRSPSEPSRRSSDATAASSNEVTIRRRSRFWPGGHGHL